jgi:hypothetical protein
VLTAGAIAAKLSCVGEDRERSLQLPSRGRGRQEESRDRREGRGSEMEVPVGGVMVAEAFSGLQEAEPGAYIPF